MTHAFPNAPFSGRTCAAYSSRLILGFLLLATIFSAVARVQDVPSRPWVMQWPYRVQIECPPGAGGAAEVAVTLAGRTTEKGDDLRLVDAQGNQQPFEIIFHDPQLQTLLTFKVPEGKPATFWLYFGNAHAGPISTVQPDPGQWAWEPRARRPAASLSQSQTSISQNFGPISGHGASRQTARRCVRRQRFPGA